MAEERWQFYKRHFLGWELIISLILTGVFFVVVKYSVGICDLELYLSGIRGSLYGTLTALGGALLGFVITGLSVLLITGDNERMKALRTSDYYSQIFDIFFSTSKYLGVLVLVSLAGLILDRGANPIFFMNVLVVWSVLIVIFRIIRCIWVLEKIVQLHILK